VVSLYANLTSTNAKNAKPNKPVNKENEKKNQKKLGEKKKKASHSNPTSEKPRNLEVAVANVRFIIGLNLKRDPRIESLNMANIHDLVNIIEHAMIANLIQYVPTYTHT
jgi:hypothetical protein